MKPIEEETKKIDPVTVLCDCINRVDVVEGSTDAEPDTWRIFINDPEGGFKIIEVSTDQLIQATKFQQRYIKVFRKPAPAELKKAWLKFVGRLGEIAQVVEDVENPLRYCVTEILQKLSQFEVTFKREDVATADSFILAHDGFLCYDSTYMRILIESITNKIDIASVGKFMVRHQIKLKNNTRIRVGGFRPSFWWFPPHVFDEYREEPFEISEVEND